MCHDFGVSLITRALLLIDVVDSTKLSQALGDVRMAQVWAAHDRLARDMLILHNGKEIDKTDGFLLLFESACEAATYAVAYHRAIAGLDPPLRARAGLHLGEIILTQNTAADVARGAKPLELDGLAKPTAARIMGLAIGGQTLLSAAAHAALAPTPDGLSVRCHGHYRLKGIVEPMELFEIGVPGEQPFSPPPDSATSYRVIAWQASWRPARETPHSLPAERDEFVGRGSELQGLAARLDAGERLVTVLGMGGAGKTRLVRRYAWTWLGDWPGGVYFCDLSEARSVAGIAFAVAAALDVPLGTDDSVAQLGRVIAGRGKCLLLLDNFEQISAHAAVTLTPWLERASQASFVVTSREVLALPAEHVMVLQPLAVDGAGVELFAVRARARTADFELTASNRPIVQEIVALLDGLPLAIELAAARVVALAPRQLLARLKDRFQILVGARGAPARQATLRSAIDWSWALLTPWEQGALAQASVFVGGFTLDAAENVLELSAWPEAPPVVDVVQSLVERSLLRVQTPGVGQRLEIDELHFGMYASIQEYAAEKLCQFEDASAPTHSPTRNAVAVGAAERHGRYFARFGTTAAIDGLQTVGGAARLRALSLEADNLVAACRRAIVRTDAAVAVATFAATWAVLLARGPYRLATELGRQVLALDALVPADRGRATHTMAVVLRFTGQSEEALQHFELALRLRRETGDRRAQGRTLYGMGDVYSVLGRIDESLQCLQDALTISREMGDGRTESMCLDSQANRCSDKGRMADALRLYQMALALCREHGFRPSEGHELCNLGIWHSLMGNSEEALQYFTEALAIARECGDRRVEGHVLGDRGWVHLRHGRLAEASDDLKAALRIALDTGNRRFEVNVRDRLGDLDLHQGWLEGARDQFERALTLARESGYRFGEGRTLGRLGRLYTTLGTLGQARQALAASEAILREVNDGWETAVLHCFFGECERAGGELAAASLHLLTASNLAQGLEAGPESELGQEIAKLRTALAGSPPASGA